MKLRTSLKNALIILLMLYTRSAWAQNCKCQDELDFVINYYEENLPGFVDNVDEENYPAYNDFKKELTDQANESCEEREACFKTLLTYVEFFQDNHSTIYSNSTNSVDESDKESVERFLQSAIFMNREVITEIDYKSRNPLDSIENIYNLSEGVYKVAIVKSPNSFREYAGVIVDSKTPLWQKGHVKFELKRTSDSTFNMFSYMRDHSLQFYKNVKFKDGILNDSWLNIKLRGKNKKVYSSSIYSDLVFKKIDSKTNYMYLPTFDGDFTAAIQDFYRTYDPIIRSKPVLIIDVRDNLGGSDANVDPLLKYLYTKPFSAEAIEVFVTKENIRKLTEYYDLVKNDTVNYDAETLNYISGEIERMQSVPDKTFIKRGETENIELNEILAYPEKIAIISNRNCASSCETLLFLAMESDKTIIVGDNSGGYVGYGDITEATTPNFNFVLSSTMTRYGIEQRKYEAGGIPPDFYFNNQQDWIEQTVELLEEVE